MAECDHLLDAGVQLAGQGRLQDAVENWRIILLRDPNHIDALHNLGAALGQLGRLDEGSNHLRRALELRPIYPEACFNLANLVWKSAAPAEMREAEAVELLKRAILDRPQFIEARYKLGTVLIECCRFQEAERMLRLAFELCVPDADSSQIPIAFDAAMSKPNHRLTASVCNQLGVAYGALVRHVEAEAAFRAALRLRPQFAEAFSNLGNCFQEQARLPEAIACYEQAAAIDPGSPVNGFNLALACLQSGDFEQGWPGYEWRWHLKSLPAAFHQPKWDGRPLDGQTVFVYPEQGMGDTIQFIRFLPLVQARGGRVLLECATFLEPLLTQCRGVDQIVLEGATLPPYDVQTPLMSLPWLLGVTLQNLPADIPYLFVEHDRVLKWHARLAAHPDLKVGILWQGDRRYAKDHLRSIPLEPFLELADVPGVQLVSLQTGEASKQLSCLAESRQVLEIMESRELGSGTLLETAALIRALDLVVTIDSGIAHLSGALGKPVWVALSSACDWRWLTGRSDSPWYPTMRLFRQSQPGQWTDVFAAMQTALRNLMKQPPDSSRAYEITSESTASNTAGVLESFRE